MTFYSMLIKELRKREKMTQEELAFAIGMSPSAYGRFERGESQISLENVKKLDTYFKLIEKK